MTDQDAVPTVSDIKMESWREGYDAASRNSRIQDVYRASHELIEALVNCIDHNDSVMGNDDEDYLNVRFDHIQAYILSVLSGDEEEMRRSLLVELHGVIHDDSCPANKLIVTYPSKVEEMITESANALRVCECTPYDRDMTPTHMAAAKRIALTVNN